jgi:two-component system, NtrC family, response regulator AtoC
LLALLFLPRSPPRYGKSGLRFSEEALEALARHRWPGNVRELGNLVEQCVILCSDPVIELEDLPLPVAPLSDFGVLEPGAGDAVSTSLPETERRLLLSALERNRWNVTQAARALGISRDTLRYRIDKFGLRP